MKPRKPNEYWAVIDLLDNHFPMLFESRSCARDYAAENRYLTDAKFVVRKVRLVEIKVKK